MPPLKPLVLAFVTLSLSTGNANTQSTCGNTPKLTDDDMRTAFAISRVFQDRYLVGVIPGHVALAMANKDCFTLTRNDQFQNYRVRIYKLDGTDCTYVIEEPGRKLARINFNKLTTQIVMDPNGAIRVRGFMGAVCNGDGTLCMTDYGGEGGGNKFAQTAHALEYIFSNVCEPARLTPEQEFNPR
jgi:hypothetical protein